MIAVVGTGPKYRLSKDARTLSIRRNISPLPSLRQPDQAGSGRPARSANRAYATTRPLIVIASLSRQTVSPFSAAIRFTIGTVFGR
jgi:hypothetical protein